MPIYNWSVGCQKIHSFVNAGMFKVWRSEELMYGLECDFVRVVYEFWWFLWDFELKDFTFFVGLDKIITAMELIFNDGFSILPT